MNKLKLSVLLLLMTRMMAWSQNPVLDNYIIQGIAFNHGLMVQRFSVEKAESELSEARGLYLPGLSVNARYTVADGGRTIQFPLRDILDGYSMWNNALNPEITLMTPDPISNEDFSFLRKNEHDTRLTLTQPLFSTKIYYQVKIRKELSEAEMKSLEVSTRLLVDDIRQAYFDYLKSVELCNWMDEAKVLSLEFVRVNESLLENDKVTADVLYRARAEDAKTDQEIAEAIKNKQVAAAWFNYLTGNSANDPIRINDTVQMIPLVKDLQDAIYAAQENREEIEQLEILDAAASYNIRMSSSDRLPSLVAVADYGFQGEEYHFNAGSDFAMASLVLQWDLFDGFQKREKLQQALLERKSLEESRQDLLKKIEIEVTQGWFDLQAAGKMMETSVLEEEAMQRFFDMTKRKYENGQSSLLEYTDARTQWTRSVMNRIIRKYDYHTAYFNLLNAMAVESISRYHTIKP